MACAQHRQLVRPTGGDSKDRDGTHLHIRKCRFEAEVELQRSDELGLLNSIQSSASCSSSHVRGAHHRKTCQNRQCKPCPSNGWDLCDPSLYSNRHVVCVVCIFRRRQVCPYSRGILCRRARRSKPEHDGTGDTDMQATGYTALTAQRLASRTWRTLASNT